MAVLIRHRAAMSAAQYDEAAPPLVELIKKQPGFLLHVSYEGPDGSPRALHTFRQRCDAQGECLWPRRQASLLGGLTRGTNSLGLIPRCASIRAWSKVSSVASRLIATAA